MFVSLWTFSTIPEIVIIGPRTVWFIWPFSLPSSQSFMTLMPSLTLSCSSLWRVTTATLPIHGCKTAEAVETLRKFFMMVGMGGDIILGRVDGTLAGPGETVHEFCSTGQAQSFWNVASHFYIAAGCSSCFCEP